MVTNLGAVYGFGDAESLGAPGNSGAPIVSAVRTPNGGGYWILDADGTVHGYGNATNLGSAAGDVAPNTASAIFTDVPGDGYGGSGAKWRRVHIRWNAQLRGDERNKSQRVHHRGKWVLGPRLKPNGRL